jgi:hypothetical protein
MMIVNEKIGMYTEDEIFKEIANGFLGRSMYDAIFDKIHALKTENEQLQQENARLKDKNEKIIEYVNHYETIRGYYEYEECGYDEYNYEEDLKEELLELLKEN